jgi:hypothetical protein
MKSQNFSKILNTLFTSEKVNKNFCKIRKLGKPSLLNNAQDFPQKWQQKMFTYYNLASSSNSKNVVQYFVQTQKMSQFLQNVFFKSFMLPKISVIFVCKKLKSYIFAKMIDTLLDCN